MFLIFHNHVPQILHQKTQQIWKYDYDDNRGNASNEGRSQRCT